MTKLPSAEKLAQLLTGVPDPIYAKYVRDYARAVIEVAAEVTVRARLKDKSYQWIEEEIRALKAH